MDFEAIEREIATFQDREFCGGVSESAIASASGAIGLPFPRGYREFLRRLGCGYVSSEEFIGLGGPPHLDVVRETLHLREHSKTSRFPDHLIPVRSDGFGNYDCIDTSRPTDAEEFEVVAWLHDGGDEQDCQELGASYFDWLLSLLMMVRSVDAAAQ
jgi:hypothetical protein